MGALVLIAIFAAVVLLALALMWMVAPTDGAVKDRLADLHKGDVPVPDAPETTATLKLSAFRRFVDRLGSAVAPSRNDPSTDALLKAAGVSGERSIRSFLALKFSLMILLPAAFGGVCGALGLLREPFAILGILALAPIGLFAPNAIYAMRGAARRDGMRRGLPDVLDLMVICVEAGMSLNAAFKRVAEKVRPAAPALADEFLQLHLEIQAGRSREDALRAMGDRAGVDEVKSLCAMMIQTDRLGTSIAKALRIHSEAIRTRFHHEAESRAARATVKLAFPLVLCIFPALLVVVVGPAAVKILAAFGEMK